jgi:hypothetical protein
VRSALLIAGMLVAWASPAIAQAPLPAGHPSVRATAAADGGAVVVDAGPIKAGPVDPNGPVPAGHPTTAPAQHGGGAGGNPDVFEAPPDTVEDDARLPAGTIEVTLLDPDNKPLPNAGLTLGIMQQSVAKGESRKHVAGMTNDAGVARFDKLETGSGIAYRVTVLQDGATFAASPFNLPLGAGIKVGLHVYPVTHDVNQALVVMQVVAYVEMKDDRIQLQQAVSVYNFGRVAWVPSDIVLALPEGFTALNGTQQMSDVGVDPIEGKGARLRGTFAPGRHDAEFRWQLPYAGDKDVSFDIGLPPRVAVARVMAVASQQMRLVVSGFPEPEARTDNQGQRILVTEKQLRRDEAPVKSLSVEIRDLPTAGPARWIATSLSALGVLAGIGLSGRKPHKRTKAEGKAERSQLLAELEELERAHRSGEVGPKTYERARRELVDALARTLAKGDGQTEGKPLNPSRSTSKATA